MKHRGIHGHTLCISAAIAAAQLSFSAQAIDFEVGDGTRIIWNTTVSLGTAQRARDADSRLTHPVNAGFQGISGGVGGNTDDGTLNYNKGDAFSTLLKLVSDVEVKHGDMGGLMRVKAWTDYALKNNNVNHGNFVNGYIPNTPLSDKGFEDLAKFSGVALLDAYVYGNFQPGIGDLKVTFGRHVLNWGESLFLQGMNQINPIDVSALRKPGAEVREALLPIGMLSANMGLGNGVSVDGFLQWQRATSVLDGCGTYFLTVDASIGPNTQNACAGGYMQTLPLASAAALAGALKVPAPTIPGDAAGLALGAYIPAAATVMPRDGGQYGLAVHFPVKSIDTEFGLYAMNIDSRIPMLSIKKGNSPLLLTTKLLGPAGSQTSVFWEYPHDVKIFGASAATTIFGWAVGSEFTHTPRLPVQINGGDLVGVIVYSAHPAALGALGIPAPFRGLMNANAGPLGSRFGVANGTVVPGYDRVRRDTLQVNGVQAFSEVLGASTFTVAGEVGMQWADVGSYDGVRYGRSFVFGVAQSPFYNLGAYPGALTQNGACPILNTAGQPGCKNDGFATPFAWGYRLRGQLAYTNAFNLGLTLKPTLSYSSDVKGYSVDGMFNKGRRIAGLSMGAEYAKRYNAEIGMVTYNRSADWDPLRDRDYYFASISVAF